MNEADKLLLPKPDCELTNGIITRWTSESKKWRGREIFLTTINIFLACYTHFWYKTIMIRSFRSMGTADIAHGENTKAARKELPVNLHRLAKIKLLAIDMAESLDDLANAPGWGLEKLGGNRAGQWSLRINRQYRICFFWTGKDAEAVEVTDYH